MMRQMNREEELLKNLKKSIYLAEYTNSFIEKKKKETLKILTSYLALKNSIDIYPCPSKVFDVVYIHIFGIKNELKKLSNLDLNFKIKTKSENLNLYNYIFFILDSLKDELKSEEKYFFGIGSINYEEFMKLLKTEKPLEDIKLSFLKRKKERRGLFHIKESFLKKKIKDYDYENIDEDELKPFLKHL
ncbi:MAG: hypothetical protein ACRC34_02890, partial [Cetobacterium sp.]